MTVVANYVRANKIIIIIIIHIIGYNYPMQTKLQKGNFLHLSVILFTGGGVSLSRDRQANTPLPRRPLKGGGTHPTGMHYCVQNRLTIGVTLS